MVLFALGWVCGVTVLAAMVEVRRRWPLRRRPVLADQPEPNCAECGVGEATKDCVEGCRERKDCQSCAAGDHYRARNDAVCLCCGEPRPTPDDQREKECAYCGELESNCTGSRHSFLPLGPMRA